jgi:hypothetical protein
VRTTITIDGELFRVFKVRAAQLGTTFSHEVEEALREKADRLKSTPVDDPFVLITAGEGSEPVAGIDYSRNAALLDLADEGEPLEQPR